jgi:hypothetical protein
VDAAGREQPEGRRFKRLYENRGSDFTRLRSTLRACPNLHGAGAAPQRTPKGHEAGLRAKVTFDETGDSF